LWLLETRGNANAVIAIDDFLLDNQEHWFAREVLGMLRRTFARLDVSSRSMYAIVTGESCFAGTLAELLLAADRAYMRDDAEAPQAWLRLSRMNFGPLPTVAAVSRLQSRQLTSEQLDRAARHAGEAIDAPLALELGLVTATPDALDWDDELRQAIETRAALSPDALTGMEASLRFPLPETQGTRVFGRLS